MSPMWPASDMKPEEFRAILAELGWTQGAAAKAAGLTRQSIGGYVAGRQRIPQLAANFFRCTLTEHRHQKPKRTPPTTTITGFPGGQT